MLTVYLWWFGGVDAGADKIKKLAESAGIDMVVLSSISWCPAERRDDDPVSVGDDDPVSVVRGPTTYFGCSFGGGFAVASSAPKAKLVWLHERGHVLDAMHMDTDKFVMSSTTNDLGRMVTKSAATTS